MSTREPLEVERLVPEEKRRLQTALAAPKPITIEEHQAFREGLAPPKPFDEIDEAAADIAGPTQMRKSREVSKLLSILDELETGKDGRH